MKITKLIIASSIGFASESVAADAPSSIRGNNNDFSHRHLSTNRYRMLENDESGTFLMKEIEYADNSESSDSGGEETKEKPSHTMNIELDGVIYTLENVDEAWAESNGNGKGIKSGQAKIKIGEGAIISGGSIDLQGGAPEVVEEEHEGESGEGGRQRNLASTSRTIGERTVLAVRVIASNAAYDNTEDYLSDKVFGSNGDPLNFASQYRECSYNQLIFRETSDYGISNGVITITVATSTSAGDDAMVQDVTSEIKQVYGVDSPSNIADHVIYCLPEISTWESVAYGFVNHWLSVYKNNWCNSPTALMHEVGHNLGFAHSSDGTEEYGDQSGLMGFSYEDEDRPAMCFNGAKSFQSNWYQTATKIITPTGEGKTCFEGPLYGVADFEVGNSAKTVVVKINDDRAGQKDYFVAFNRKTGINSGTMEGADQVLITATGQEGNSWSLSNLVARLNEGQAAAIRNFGGTNDRLVIRVHSIDTASNPGFARIRINFEGAGLCEGTFPPTASPSASPTIDCPGKILKVDVTTDNFPEETSWTLTNTCGVAPVGPMEEVKQNTLYTSAGTYYSNEYCVADAAYNFTINDTYGDGMCCSWGAGSYSLQYGGIEVASGGQFASSEEKTFGICQPVPVSPTHSPTTTPAFNCGSITRKRRCRREPGCDWSNYGFCVNV